MRDTGPESILTYTYHNAPHPSAEDDMAAHKGTAVLRRKGKHEMRGHYYTGQGRKRYGEIVLKREPDGWLF
jgi:hypothetical protein